MTRPLLTNHLAFLRSHRGQVIPDPGGITVASPAPYTSVWIPMQAHSTLPADCCAVRLVPWSGRGWETKLGRLGFMPAEELSYMQHARGNLPPEVSSDVARISLVSSQTEALEFARTQHTAFLSGDDPDSAWWSGFLAVMAQKNFSRTNQRMFLARVADLPVATMMLVNTVGTVGIYALSTLPTFRGRGICGALLNRAITVAGIRGSKRVALQAITGSYAEGLYQRSGFETVFRSRVWRRVKHSDTCGQP